MRPEIRRNRKNKAKKARGKYLDALQKATENESMNRMINSNPSGGMRSGRYTASTGGRVGLKHGGQPSYKHGEMHSCKPN